MESFFLYHVFARKAHPVGNAYFLLLVFTQKVLMVKSHIEVLSSQLKFKAFKADRTRW